MPASSRRCKQRPSTPHSQIQTDSRSKIEDEDEFEDDYREASRIVANQIKSDRQLYNQKFRNREDRENRGDLD